MKPIAWSFNAVLATLLTACGGGGGGGGGAGDESPARGDLKKPPVAVATLLSTTITADVQAKRLIKLTGPARCDVRVIALDYHTPGVHNDMSNSTGVMLVPQGDAQDCKGPFPLLTYARGTQVNKTATLADSTNSETALLAAVYASHGYAVVAPDYLGYAGSAYSFHPYLHADSQATTLIDAIRAARHAAASFGIALSGQVMLSGYSQGGHAAMSAQRVIERDHAKEIDLAGAAHQAGPYIISAALKHPEAFNGYQFFMPLLMTSWQKIYGGIYTSASDAFNHPYATYIDNLLPHPTWTDETLITEKILPGLQVENPKRIRDALLKPDFIRDLQTNTKNRLVDLAQSNDMLGWDPVKPTLLCSGSRDPTVLPNLHQNTLMANFEARGIKTVKAVDADELIQKAFGPPPEDTTEASHYDSQYHGSMTPPVCAAVSKCFFDQIKKESKSACNASE